MICDIRRYFFVVMQFLSGQRAVFNPCDFLAVDLSRIHCAAFRRCSAFVRGLGGVFAETLLYLAVICAVVLRSGKDVYLAQRVAAHFLERLGGNTL